MNIMKRFAFTFALLISCCFSVFAGDEVPLALKEDGKTYLADLYLPRNLTAPVPLVVVVHEWWGKAAHPRSSARRIANELGYAALAVDLFGDGKTVASPEEAKALASPFYQNPAMGVNRLQAFIAAAPEAAKKSGVTLDGARIAAIGYCFGGAQALNLARAWKTAGDRRLTAVVAFHASLASSLKSDKIASKVLVLHGAADSMVKSDEVAAFKSEMKKANTDLTFISYPGAKHAFTNPDATAIGKKYRIPIEYDKSADAKSWQEMSRFLKNSFGS